VNDEYNNETTIKGIGIWWRDTNLEKTEIEIVV
jgi:hypothetical protein